MVAGFAVDNYFYGRVDHPRTQFLLFGYIWLAIASMVFVHVIETHGEPQGWMKKIRPLVVAAMQFAFGALWSAFLVFYGRSAVFAASWPFLIVLAAIFIGNEVFRRY